MVSTLPCFLALEISSNDPKALFRRCQALENLNRTDEAYKDARLLAHMQPGDSSTQEILQRLSMKLQDIVSVVRIIVLK